MNALKHMELVFVAALLLAGSLALVPEHETAPAPRAMRAAPMQVVVVKGKRMTALEKRASLSAEAGARPQANDS